MLNKKNYNAFKMWGSWIGAIILLIFTYTLMTSILMGDVKGIFELESLKWFFLNIKSYIIILIGFLIGWGIHSLFRRFRK